MAQQKQKYRPGIDDPPPTLIMWIMGSLGLTPALSFLLAFFKRMKSRQQRSEHDR
jgi:hypothetical protein